MSEQDKIYLNLVILLKQFWNRPHHLAKFFLDKEVFNDFFIKHLLESKRLNELENQTPPIFKDIEEMNDYYDIFKEPKNKTEKQKADELNQKLEECIKLEKYEDAIRIRDYMIKMGFKINS